MSLKKFRLPLSLLGVFVLLLFFFLPLLQGKVLLQSDTQGWKGMFQEIKTFKEKTGEHSYWTGSMFSGMPTINIDSGSHSNLFSYAEKAFGWIPSAVWMLFVTFLGFFLLLRVLGVRHWLAVIGGLAYMFSSYFIIITAVGHVTKMHAISFMAFVVAGLLLTYRGKYWKGGLLFAISLSLHILANHPQITYYLLLLVLLYGIFELVKTIRGKSWQNFIKASLVLVIGAALAVGTNAENLYKVYDSAQVSIRGKQILQEETEKEGVDLQYATEWSYGKDETLTLLIPNVKGGATNGKALDKASESYAVLEKMRVQNPERALKGLPVYWGTQLFTEGGVYVGALVCFLFIFGLLSVRGYLKWWLLAATVLAVLLAWGRNFMGLYEFFYYNFPLFSKFRTPSTILVLVEFTMPLLAFLGINEVLKETKITTEIKKNLLWSAVATVGVCLLLWLIPTLVGDFSNARDMQLPEPLRKALLDDRKALLRSDALRSALIVLVALGIIWLAIGRKLKELVVFALLGLLVVFDMWNVDRRFLSDDNYEDKAKVERFRPYAADLEILKDKGLSYRVLDITESTFQSSRASYFHKSIGGYHAAKMRRYQDLVEYHLQPEIQTMVKKLQAQQAFDSVMLQLPALRMLNLRYLLFNPQAAPLSTAVGLGNAWFVQDVKRVQTPKEEILAIGEVDVANVAILNKEEEAKLGEYAEKASGTIEMTQYKPNELTYESTSNSGGLAVFSEIFHPDWQAMVDGEIVPVVRANYTLLAVNIPKGSHEVKLVFKPSKYKIWKWVGLVSSIVLLLLVVLGIFRISLKKKEL